MPTMAGVAARDFGPRVGMSATTAPKPVAAAGGTLAPQTNGRQYQYNAESNAYDDVGQAVNWSPKTPMMNGGQNVNLSGDQGGGRAAAYSGPTGAGLDALKAQVSNSQNNPPSAVNPGPMPGNVAGPNSKPGTDAALLRAKERQGQIAQSAVTGLREALGERQMLGSGAEAQATGDIAASAAQGISDVNREQLIQDDNNAQKLAELSYTGGIQQRGQDITARGQNIQAQQGSNNTALSQQQMILDALRQMVY